ncbi:MAG: hypothetical protein J7530_20220 [Novosphingobium sp.]|nr:hypothetical protein [Novosphingobium sp.]
MRSDPYSRGYDSGVKQRGHDTSYRNGTIPARAGMTLRSTSMEPSALGLSADGEMHERGFVDVDALQSGNSSYSVQYNRQIRQCIQMMRGGWSRREHGGHVDRAQVP